jgi:hypothetical protein
LPVARLQAEAVPAHRVLVQLEPSRHAMRSIRR